MRYFKIESKSILKFPIYTLQIYRQNFPNFSLNIHNLCVIIHRETRYTLKSMVKIPSKIASNRAPKLKIMKNELTLQKYNIYQWSCFYRKKGSHLWHRFCSIKIASASLTNVVDLSHLWRMHIICDAAGMSTSFRGAQMTQDCQSLKARSRSPQVFLRTYGPLSA